MSRRELLQVVAEALRSSTKEWLWLDDNAIGDEGAEALLLRLAVFAVVSAGGIDVSQTH